MQLEKAAKTKSCLIKTWKTQSVSLAKVPCCPLSWLAVALPPVAPHCGRFWRANELASFAYQDSGSMRQHCSSSSRICRCPRSKQLSDFLDMQSMSRWLRGNVTDLAENLHLHGCCLGVRALVLVNGQSLEQRTSA